MERMKKRIVLACGGTGGHIHPAVAVGDVLRAEGHDLALILSGTRTAEAHVAKTWQGPLLKSGARPIKDPRNLFAILRCRRFLKQQKPDVLLATGGYTSFAPVVAARTLGIPVVLHEANSLAGRAVRFLAKWCKLEAVALSFEETASQLPGVKTVFTGLPLRQSVLDTLERARQVKRDDATFNILVTGGSQGARGMNQLVAPVLASLAASDPQVRIVHQCGAANLEEVKDVYASVAAQVEVVPFIEDMGTAYGRADVVIARAGAATCFEIAHCAVPTIFIPLPTAADDHQTKNAQSIVQCGGAICLQQYQTTPAQFAEVLRTLYSDADTRNAMRASFAKLPQLPAAQTLAKLLIDL